MTQRGASARQGYGFSQSRAAGTECTERTPREVLEGGGGDLKAGGGGGFGWDPPPPRASNPKGGGTLFFLQSTPAYLWMVSMQSGYCLRHWGGGGGLFGEGGGATHPPTHPPTSDKVA